MSRDESRDVWCAHRTDGSPAVDGAEGLYTLVPQTPLYPGLIWIRYVPYDQLEVAERRIIELEAKSKIQLCDDCATRAIGSV